MNVEDHIRSDHSLHTYWLLSSPKGNRLYSQTVKCVASVRICLNIMKATNLSKVIKNWYFTQVWPLDGFSYSSNLYIQIVTSVVSFGCRRSLLTSSTRTEAWVPPALLNAQGKLRSPAPSADFNMMNIAAMEDRLGLPHSPPGLASKLMLSLANSSIPNALPWKPL